MDNVPDKPLRVVATYTTIPSRYDYLRKSIQSMRAQTHPLDAIYLTIPKRSHRLNKEYPPIPQDIADMCTIIYIDTDYGPITKIFGALVSETGPDTVIISCDDDVGFEPDHVEIMLKFHRQNPKSVICGTGAFIGRGLWFISIVSTVGHQRGWNGFTGFEVPPQGRKVDLIFGVAGVLYTRSMFPINDKLHEEIFKHSLAEESIFFNDDVLISGYLSKMGIERRVFNGIPEIIHYNGTDALCSDLPKMIMRLHTAINKVKELGFYSVMEPLPIDETPTSRVFIGIVVAIIVIVLMIFLWKGLNWDGW